MTALLTLNNVSMCFRSKEGQRHTVFDGIDLRLDPSECLAVVGRNGSGKSTLLRVMARILAPTTGSVDWAPGVTASGLSLGLGFNPELSGRDNAFLSCLLMGLSRKDAAQSLDSIESFCEIGDFFMPLQLLDGMRALGIWYRINEPFERDPDRRDARVGDAFFEIRRAQHCSRSFLKTGRCIS